MHIILDKNTELTTVTKYVRVAFGTKFDRLTIQHGIIVQRMLKNRRHLFLQTITPFDNTNYFSSSQNKNSHLMRQEKYSLNLA